MKMTDEADQRVRYQLAFTLGAFTGQDTTAALVRLARTNGSDNWFRVAILSSAHAVPGDLLTALLADEVRTTSGGRLRRPRTGRAR